MTCETKPFCADAVRGCPSPWDINQDKVNCLADSLVAEALNIAGAPINFYKLLGIHEQGKLIDLVGQGLSISGGDSSIYVSQNAFFSNNKEWRSLQKGTNVISNAYIGYDFGPVKLDNDRLRYGVETAIRHHITTIVIKQGSQSKNRCTSLRVERSDDGVKWYGVAIITLPDDNKSHQLSFKQSAAARYWRLRPVLFNGSSSDYWAVVSIQMMDYEATTVGNIQDLILLENRTRDYADTPIKMKSHYDLLDVQTEMSKFGLNLPSQIFFMTVHFGTCVTLLGRPVVMGDIIEMPSEVQYDRNMQPVKKLMEVTDVGWSTEGYTPGWKPTMLRLILQPAMSSEETQDLFGDLTRTISPSGLLEIDDSKYQSFLDSNDAIGADAKTQVPERGEDIANIANIPNAQVTQQQIDNAANTGINIKEKLNINPKSIYVEDAMPPNGEPYTEGPQSPTNPKNGDWHRLTYVGTAAGVPTRLERWSSVKNRWMWVETDKRAQFDGTKPTIEKILKDKDGVPTSKVDK